MKKYHFILLFVFGLIGCNNGNATQGNQSEQNINKNIDVKKFAQSIAENKDITLLDVRTEDEFSSGHLAHALNININDAGFTGEVEKLDKNKPVYVYCLSGGRSSNAATYLAQQGFKEVYNLQGGIIAWKNADMPIMQENHADNQGMNLVAYTKLVNTDKMVLVDFYAPWCGPCKILSPIVKEVEGELGTFKLHKINYDEAGEVVNSLKISAIPLLVLYKDGKEVWKHNGTISKQELIKVINEH